MINSDSKVPATECYQMRVKFSFVLIFFFFLWGKRRKGPQSRVGTNCSFGGNGNYGKVVGDDTLIDESDGAFG